jgi:hypothetical protein
VAAKSTSVASSGALMGPNEQRFSREGADVSPVTF